MCWQRQLITTSVERHRTALVKRLSSGSEILLEYFDGLQNEETSDFDGYLTMT